MEGTVPNKTLRVAVVGATLGTSSSGWATRAHVPALHALPECELAAICTTREASARAAAAAFGAPLAFHDFDELVAHREIDLISIVVRVPHHHALVMNALRASKAVLCEWPLAANLTEAAEAAELAAERRAPAAVGLQARCDPVLIHARHLLRAGEIGDVLAVNLTVRAPVEIERTGGRMWQGDRGNGANTLTIAGGHSLDAVCFIAGEIVSVSGRVATRISEWRNAETGEAVAVDAPDTVSVIGRLEDGAEFAGSIVSVPSCPPHYRLDIYGSRGMMALSGPVVNVGPNRLAVARAGGDLADEPAPASLTRVPRDVPPGPQRNVAEQYARLAATVLSGDQYHPDLAAGTRRHELLDAIERSSRENRTVRVR
jgi:predicted dehydrogenase